MAVFDEHGALTNFHDAVGEFVNIYGGGGFSGYYNDVESTARRMSMPYPMIEWAIR